MKSDQKRGIRGFTLVELLVVIGIIALLISILLPTLGRVRAQANSVSCQSNLRTLGQSINTYVAENKQSYPWGDIYQFAKLPPPLGNFTTGADGAWDTAAGGSTVLFWSTIIDAQMKKRANNLWSWSVKTNPPNKVFQCPDASSNTSYYNPVHYMWNPVVMASPYAELTPPDPGGSTTGNVSQPILRPAKSHMVWNDTAILWDAPLMAFITAASPSPGGWGFSYIDGGELMYPECPSWRFRHEKDQYTDAPFKGTPDEIYHSFNRSIYVPTKATYVNTNTDGTSTTGAQYGQIGVPRWRHKGNTVCNVLMADGSVRAMTVNWKKTLPGDPDSAQNDFLRKYIRAKYPAPIQGDKVP